MSALTGVAWCIAIPSAEAAPGPRFGENVLLPPHSAGRARDVPGLAVDPANSNHIVEAEIDAANLQCDYNVSFDGGTTWAGGHLTAVDPGLNPPFPTPACDQNFDSGGYAHFNTGVVFGSGQNVYATFSVHRGAFNRPESNLDGGNGDDSVVARSTDGGVTFQPASLAVFGGGPILPGQPGLAGFGSRPQLAVQRGAGSGGRDRLYLASWNCFIKVRASQTARGGCSGGGGDRRVFVTRSDDSGATWGTPVLASAAAVRVGGAIAEAASADEQAREPSQPVVGPDGAIYVAYRNRDITDGTVCPANPDITGLAGTFTRTLAQCIVVSRSTDLGVTWQQFATQPVNPNTLSNPRLAIDPTTPAGVGTLYVTYQRIVGTDGADISIQKSTDRAATWSAPVRVNNDPPGAAVGTAASFQTNPSVSVSLDGRVNVIWGDKRHTYPGGAGDYGDTYFASSSDGAATFPDNRRVTDRTTNFQVGRAGDTGSTFSNGGSWYGPVALPLANGGVLAAFMDSRTGSADSGIQDIFLSRLTQGAEIGSSSISAATPEGLSVRLSRLAYPGGNEGPVGDAVSRVVVANDSDVAGALAAAPLARASFGPELLSPAGGLPAIVKAESARIRPLGAYVIGDTTKLSTSVSADLAATTRSGENVSRIAASTAVPVADRDADVARQIAELMRPLATPRTAIIANPATPEAVAASGLASARRLPILYVDARTTIPPPTAAAISSGAITNVVIVGGTQSVNAGVETALVTLLGALNVTRVAGADQYATSQNLLIEGASRGLPSNVVYVADGGRRIDAAVLGAAVGRLSVQMLLTPGAGNAAAQSILTTLGFGPAVDRTVSAIGTGGTDPTIPVVPVATPPIITVPVPAAPAQPVASGGPLVALTKLKVSPASFRAAGSGAPVTSASSGVGTRVSYTLNVAGAVRFVVERRSTGRSVGGRCVKTSKSNSRRKQCTRYTRLTGSFARTRSAGADRFTFTGRLGGRRLAVGSYRLVATPSAGGRTGTAKRVAFRIAK